MQPPIATPRPYIKDRTLSNTACNTLMTTRCKMVRKEELLIHATETEWSSSIAYTKCYG
jgi:hypothetical protein